MDGKEIAQQNRKNNLTKNVNHELVQKKRVIEESARENK